MSRSADAGHTRSADAGQTRPVRRFAPLLLLVLGLALACVAVPPAVAAPSPAATARVDDITAPVLDIVVSTADVDREIRVDESTRSVRFVLDATLLFDRDSAAVRPGADRRLRRAAARLSSRGPGTVRVVGYTDDLGSAAHGLDLSRRRAGAVADLLRRQLPASTYPMTVIGRGEADPAVPNTSEANRRLNRRVVVSYESR